MHQRCIERTVEWLNSRYQMTQREDARPQELSFYNGAIKAIESLGYYWRRDENGKHEIW